MMPARDLSTMSEAIALSSPSGRMSKRAKERANERLSVALFGPGGLARPTCPQPTRREYLERRIQECRDFRDRGFRPRVMAREIARLEAEMNA